MISRRRISRRLGLNSVLLAARFLVVSVPSADAELEEIVVHSPALEGNPQENSPDRNVTIYLPPAYEERPEARYPVLYLLHGSTGTNRLWTGSGYLSGFNIKNALDALIREKEIRPMIVVMPDANTKFDGSWYTNSVLTGN